MEEDDDFGELYSDVLPPFATSPPPPQIRRPIDLNTIDNGDHDFTPIHHSFTFQDTKTSENGKTVGAKGGGLVGESEELGLGSRVLEKFGFGEEEDVDVVVEEVEGDDKGGDLVEKDGDLVEYVGGAMIPGGGDLNFEEETDSESEDDLMIVLNDDSEIGVMGMERMGGMGGGDGDEDEDEDGDSLVILAGNDTLGNPPMMENAEWGEEGGAGGDGERKELGDGTKVNGGVAVHQKAPYGNHGFYHPFHSQFKVSDVAHLGCRVYRLFFDEILKYRLYCNCCIVRVLRKVEKPKLINVCCTDGDFINEVNTIITSYLCFCFIAFIHVI